MLLVISKTLNVYLSKQCFVQITKVNNLTGFRILYLNLNIKESTKNIKNSKINLVYQEERNNKHEHSQRQCIYLLRVFFITKCEWVLNIGDKSPMVQAVGAWNNYGQKSRGLLGLLFKPIMDQQFYIGL